MDIISIIQNGVVAAVKALYGGEISPESVTLSPTRREFEGDYTVVVFPFTKMARKKPDVIGAEIGEFMKERVPEIEDFNVIKGFLNLSLSAEFWKNFLEEAYGNPDFGRFPSNGERVMVEFSSPNTNKPLHLGHIRNILLGWSCSRILEAAGYEVIKTQIVNNRGIAICKSMLSWKKFANGATPESAGVKGDKFVGDYYVLFTRKFEEEYEKWQATPEAKSVYESRKKAEEDAKTFFKRYKNDYFNEFSELGREAKEMLVKWEQNDPETIALWEKMNNWVLAGFDETYRRLGVHFDKLYFESDTYLLGKEIIEEGLEKGVFHRDGKRVWVDLENIGLGQKTIIKSDGTSTYTSQDLGTARLRWEDFKTKKMVYVVGDEQISHFQGLFEIMKRLGEPYADGLFHLAYGMVDLPTGRMKTREGTVVDADDLIDEVIEESRKNAKERGEIHELPAEAQEDIIRKIGMAALKYFIIKVHPKKRMVFDPKESVDLQGQTGPYIQNAYVRIQSVLRKGGAETDLALAAGYVTPETLEKDILNQIYQYPDLVLAAARDYDPSAIANYSYNLAKTFHRFYHDHSILKAESEPAKAFRLQLAEMVARVLASAMDLLGIEMPDRM
ncbi:MAG: arginine--tRNA ligase [Bacteroidetes bacterium]|nr:MAG: arginine--tRNA ligase [Bacteroidota bacterium]